VTPGGGGQKRTERSVAGKILVTGATGNVGREVVKDLLAHGEPVVAAVLDDEDGRQVREGTPTVLLGFCRVETFGPALHGVDRLFLMRPPAISDVRRTLCPLVDLARHLGIRQIVFLSLFGAGRNRLVPHHRVEQHLQWSGIPFTFLRPSFYMQNLNTTHCIEIAEKDEILVPAGRSRTSFVDVRDVGAVAARVLTEPGHEYAAYELTGAEALDYYQVAALFSGELGRQVTYRQPSIPRFVRAMRGRRTPWPFILVMVGLYTATRSGAAAQVTDQVERLLGRPPITVRQYIRDYRDCWNRLAPCGIENRG
jgi:uncharacterized protein YbjT (DUF2867 family)